MSNREDHLKAYIHGWKSMDVEVVRSVLADGFVFDDPALPAPVTKASIADYMASWAERIHALSGAWVYENSDEVIDDQDGVLLRWKWWRFTGTHIQGSAVTKTTDKGMIYERLAYFTTPAAAQDRAR